MMLIKDPWGFLFKFFFFGFGVPFTVMGIIAYWMFEGNIAFLLNGLIWILFGALCYLKDNLNKRQLKRLKSSGRCFEATVKSLTPANWMKIGNYVTAKVTCTAVDNPSMTYKSNYLLLSPFDRPEYFQAIVYTDPQDSKFYKIELYRHSQASF